MSQWDFFGTERREAFERELKPEELAEELRRYQKVLGKTFGISELLQLEQVRSRALIAQAINDLPEFLLDQIGKMRNSMNVDTVTKELQYMAEALARLADR